MLSPIQRCVYHLQVATSVASCTTGCDKIGKLRSAVKMIALEIRDSQDPKAFATEFMAEIDKLSKIP